MRRIARLSFVAALGCLVAAPSRADEILFFANGTTMAIKSHLIKDGMIHVDLGAKASMAFPASSVDRIEMAGRPVYTTGGKTANQAVPGAPGGSTEQDGRAGVSSQYRGAGAVPPSTGSNDGTPAPAMASPVSGRLNSAMNPSNQSAPQGMQRVGNRIGFAPPKLGQPAAGAITGFGKRPAAPAPPPAAGDGSAPPDDTPPVAAPPDGLPEVGHPDDGEGDGDDEDSPE